MPMCSAPAIAGASGPISASCNASHWRSAIRASHLRVSGYAAAGGRLLALWPYVAQATVTDRREGTMGGLGG